MHHLLEVLRVQRHDFVNHLQVISGLLQLKKYDRAAEYIKEVAEKTARDGMLGRLNCPEIVSVILAAELKASKQGISINGQIETGLENGVKNSTIVAEIIKEMLDLAVQSVEVSPCMSGSINFEISETAGLYHFRISFQCRESEATLGKVAAFVFIEEAATKVNGKFTTGNSADGGMVISLAIPVASG